MIYLPAAAGTPEYEGNVKIGNSPLVAQPAATTQYKVVSVDTCTGTRDTFYLNVFVRAPISATLTNDTTICKGQTVNLSIKAEGGDSSYTYTWLNGLAGPGFKDTTVTPDTTTTYTVAVSDECSLKADTLSTTVFVRPILVLQPPADTTICTQQTLVLRPRAMGGDSTYSFKWNNSGAISDTLAFSSDTTTTLEIWLTDGCTVKPDTGWVTIFVRPNPQIRVSNDTTICAGGTADMKARESWVTAPM